MPLDADGLLLELPVPMDPVDEPIVPDDEPMVLLPVPDEAVLPRLRQGVVLPLLDDPMLLVPEPVLESLPVPALDPIEPVLEPMPLLEPVPVLAPGLEEELLEEDCACTANEAAASAALAARTASLWILVMSEVLWVNHVRSDSGPLRLPCAGARHGTKERRATDCSMDRIPQDWRQQVCPATWRSRCA